MAPPMTTTRTCNDRKADRRRMSVGMAGCISYSALLLMAACSGEVTNSGDDDSSDDGGTTVESDGGVVTETPDARVLPNTVPPELNPDISGAGPPGPPVFWIATTGNDSGPGSMTQPWRTVGKAAATLAAGQTACVQPGEYRESPRISRAGTVGKPIAIIGANTNRSAKLVGELQMTSTARYVRLGNLDLRNSGGGEAITLLGARNVELINIEVRDSNKMWWQSVDGLLLKQGWIHHNVIGIDCTPGPCNNVAIVDTIIECAGFAPGATCTPATSFTFGGPNDGLGAEADSSNWRIIRSIARFNKTDGFDIKGTNITIEGSQSYGNAGGGFKIWGGGTTSVTNSLAFHNNNGIELYESSGASYVVKNNTSADNHLASLAIYADNGHFPIRLELRNNIFASEDGNTYDDHATVSGTCNLYWNVEDEQVKGGSRSLTKADVTAGRTPDTAALAADPMFVKRDTGLTSDYHLKAGSPGLNSGSADLAPAADLAGNPRPSGGGVDRGAYEN